MSSDIAISVCNVSKYYQIYDKPLDRLKQSIFRGRKQFYKEFKALDNVSFEIKRGETVGIIGLNGSGKSTLLQIICGTLTPTNGEVRVNGKVAALLELGAGFNPEFTGRENVFLNAALYDLTYDQISDRFDRIEAFADIGEFIEQPVKTYSSGMFVRLAFAVIAHVDADVLVIDEALAVGDAYFVQKCMRFLRAFTQQGTLLFVSHDTSAVVGLCSKALLMNKGKIERLGEPKDVSEYYLAMLHKVESDAEVSSVDIKTIIESERPVTLISNSGNDFGEGKATITAVSFQDVSGEPLLNVCGGEEVNLIVECRAKEEFENPIVGFTVRDGLGQIIFGGNTFLTYQHKKLILQKNKLVKIVFNFIMPALQDGDYSVSVAIAQGTQLNHTQHHWVHDAVIIYSRLKSHSFGMVAVPMKNIDFIVN